ncbi:MAG: hypothetical protein OXC54_00395, partial [Rhodospirillaceae bacterium]|nr:hypothetical protein [Rhodospirillaceae bacterium]
PQDTTIEHTPGSPGSAETGPLHFAHPVDRGQSWLRQNNLHCLDLPQGASIVAILLFFVPAKHQRLLRGAR